MRVKKKRYSFTRNCESARGGGPRRGRWTSVASLEAIVEVVEVVQRVAFCPTSRDGADTSEDPAGGTLGTNQRGQPVYSCEEQLG